MDISALVSSIDARPEFRKRLKRQRKKLARRGRIRAAIRIGYVLNDPVLFERAYNHAVIQAAELAVESGIGDGDFGKFFLDWLKNGGFEIILQFIRLLIGI